MKTAMEKDQLVMEPLLDFRTLAEASGLTESYLRKAKAHHGLPYYKIGGSVRFRASEVNSWIKARRTQN